MARNAQAAPTKSQVNRAGRILRRGALEGTLELDLDVGRPLRWFRADTEGNPVVDPEVDQALLVLDRFRAAHQYALTKATMGLRSMVSSAGCQIEVSQRLKRQVTILDKLRREPAMQLATMHDIGGCRAVLSSIDEVWRVERRLRKNQPQLRTYDYISQPKASGYRAVHAIVHYQDKGGERRTIEVQLRTEVMHEWAIAVERLSGRLNEDLKGGRGPADVLAFLNAAAEAMALEEAGKVVPQALLDRISELKMATVGYASNRPSGTRGPQA